MKQMRTIADAYEYVKQHDPDTALTLYALRCMVKTGKIPSVPIGEGKRKRLINLDELDSYLSGTAEAPAPDRGKIRKVGA